MTTFPPNRFLSRLVCGLLACASVGGAAKPWTLPHYASATDTPYSVQVKTGIVYGLGATEVHGDKELLMDAYVPIGPGLSNSRKAAIVFMHPGSFRKGGRASMADACMYLARLGVVAFTIDYRMEPDSPLVEISAWQQANIESLLPPTKPRSESLVRAATAAFIDTKAALRYVHAHAEEIGIDTANIFLGGGSAGAVAALVAGVTPSDVYVSDSLGKAIRPENHPEASMSVRGIVNWSGGLYAELRHLGAEDPPIMNYHGDLDEIVDLEEAIRIVNRCELVGLDGCELHRSRDSAHLPDDGAPAGDFHSVTTSFVMRNIVSPQVGTAGVSIPSDRPRWTKGGDGSLVLAGLPESVRTLECVGLDGRSTAVDVFERGGVWAIRPESVNRQAMVVRVRLANGATRSWLVPPVR